MPSIDRKDILMFDGAVLAGIVVIISIALAADGLRLLVEFGVFYAITFAAAMLSVSAGFAMFTSEKPEKDHSLNTCKVFTALGLFGIVLTFAFLTSVRLTLLSSGGG